MRIIITRYKRLIIFTIVVSFLVGTSLGCAKNKSASAVELKNNKQEEIVVPVETIVASKGDLTDYITITGEVKPIQSTNITPQLQAEVKEIYVSVGDKVNKDDRLLQLDKDTISVQVEQAQAGLDAAQANLEKVLVGTRPEKLDQLEAQVEQAKANYEQAKKAYQRQQKLYEKKVISSQQLEGAKTKYIAAKSGYQSAQKSLELAKQGATKEDIKVMKAQVAQAESALRSAQLRLDKTVVTAPMTGVISSVDIEVGEMAVMRPVISIVNLNQVKVITYVSERNINKLEVGEQVKLNFDALDKAFIGKIENISPVADHQRKRFPVEIILNNKANQIKAGMYAQVKYRTALVSDQIVLPQKAVLEDEIGNYVYVVSDNEALRKDVTSGLSADNKVVILSGIEQGDKVIITGQNQISNGNKINVVNRGGQ